MVPMCATRDVPPNDEWLSSASISGALAPPSITRITSSRPPKAPIGVPPPMLLARQKRSGWTPKYSVAPP